MPRAYWNPLPAVSATSMAVKRTCVSIPFPSHRHCGVKGMDHLMDFAEKMSPLGNATADECADYCVMMFSDLTRKVTMQNLYHDGGFSSMGMSLRAMNQYSKGLEEYTDENGHIIYG